MPKSWLEKKPDLKKVLNLKSPKPNSKISANEKKNTFLRMVDFTSSELNGMNRVVSTIS